VATPVLIPGEAVPPLVKDPITKVQLVKYAGASGDYNLIHTDLETARAAGLPGIIAHGMLSMGFLGQFLVGLVGPEGVRRLRVRFNAVVRPGDVLTCRGTVTAVRETGRGRRMVELEVWIENQEGERVTMGEAEVIST
jgi:acyl dehydratase